MKDTVSISIPQPCQENWDSFSTTTLGGFCSSCQKEVIDFTTWDEDQIKNYFKHATASTCGRFKISQLKTYSIDSTKASSPRWVATSLLSLMTILSAQQVSAQQQQRKPSSHEIRPVPGVIQDNSLGRGSATRTVRGVVYDDANMPLPGVNVHFKAPGNGITTDKNGAFELSLPKGATTHTLIFSFVGFLDVEKIVTANDSIQVVLQPDRAALDEQIIVGGCFPRRFSPRGIWWKIKNLFRRDN